MVDAVAFTGEGRGAAELIDGGVEVAVLLRKQLSYDPRRSYC